MRKKRRGKKFNSAHFSPAVEECDYNQEETVGVRKELVAFRNKNQKRYTLGPDNLNPTNHIELNNDYLQKRQGNGRNSQLNLESCNLTNISDKFSFSESLLKSPKNMSDSAKSLD